MDTDLLCNTSHRICFCFLIPTGLQCVQLAVFGSTPKVALSVFQNYLFAVQKAVSGFAQICGVIQMLFDF
jgi:hypothetical protein